jgi:hypothetical protein
LWEIGFVAHLPDGSECGEQPSFERICEAVARTARHQETLRSYKTTCVSSFEIIRYQSRSIALQRSASAVPPTVKRFALDGKTGVPWQLHALKLRCNAATGWASPFTHGFDTIAYPTAKGRPFKVPTRLREPMLMQKGGANH